jgi:hypothetical protein
MAIEEFVVELGKVGLWIQAVGLVVILWIIVTTTTLFFNRKRRKLLEDIDRRLKRIEGKIGSLVKKKR